MLIGLRRPRELPLQGLELQLWHGKLRRWRQGGHGLIQPASWAHRDAVCRAAWGCMVNA
jgi:hypothetical protein